MMAYGLSPAEILLPKGGFETWAVIACDQHTSQREYWDAVEQTVKTAPSTLRLTLPEVYLNDRPQQRIDAINHAMQAYLQDGVLQEYPDAMMYVERSQSNGRCRRGLVGVVDLEQYDYHPGSHCAIRATEQTVMERIPPRVRIRRNAALELPHALLMANDTKRQLIEPLAARARELPLAYDFDLMQGGGHICGRFLDDKAKASVAEALRQLGGGNPEQLLFVVGDGNHSLATAKECYRLHPTPQNRYALVEVVNIHDPAIEFEPIYRVLFGVEPETVIAEMKTTIGLSESRVAQSVECCFGNRSETLSLQPSAKLPIGTLQPFIDDYLVHHPNASVDYIHGADVVRRLSERPDTLGLLFQGIEKSDLFPAIQADGSLPRKTFSMGHACDKRYYIECRRI